MPTINIPAKVRFALYIVSAVGSVVAAYLFAKGYVGDPELGLWAGFVAIINGLAAAKTDTDEPTYGNRKILGKSVMSAKSPRPTEKGSSVVYVLLVILIVLAILAVLPAVLTLR